MGPTGTVRNDTVRHVLATAARHLGDGLELVAARAQVRLSDIETHARSPRATLHRVWDAIVARGPSPLPALVAEGLTLEQLGPFGFAILTAPSGHDALAAAVASFPLINDFGRFAIERGTITRLCVTQRLTPGSRGAAASEEAILAHFVAGLRRIVPLEGLRLRFTHPRPSYARAFADAIGSSVRWDAATTELTIDSRLLEHAPPQASTATHDLLRAHLAREVDALARGSLRQRLSNSLHLETASAHALATTHGLSERTLRRKLRAEGTSLRALRDTERARDADRLLSDLERPLGDIARTLGFSEPSAFARAYRRWTGRAPSDTRRELRRKSAV